ncbi:MAG TPA: KH domain-containing protein [Patescibacteria group bacterium]|nr:KH domain-containing protein [Patescibacteria group bacterium]
MAEKDQEFVEYVVQALVSHPDDVTVKRTVDEMGVLIELTVNPEDMGQVIGKEGQTAKALRTLLRVLGAKNNARINLKIIEPAGGQRSTEAKKEEEPQA